jgi:PiT family inorganic phosphate transporter
MGAGIAAAGFGVVNWPVMGKIAASWVISPVMGGMIAALFLAFVKSKIIYQEDKIAGARRWVPVLVALMAGVFSAYLCMKGLKRIWEPDPLMVTAIGLSTFIFTYAIMRPVIARKSRDMENRNKSIRELFHIPLIFAAALLSFAHGANDVANAVGPLAAILSSFGPQDGLTTKISIPLWVMLIGATGIALGLMLFGPKLINTVGQKITRLNAPRAFCVALASAITVLIATVLGLPVSSTHIAIGAIFGVGFLRESMENPNKRRLRPGHKLNHTAEEAFKDINIRLRRKLVRRQFVYSITSAWIITVPASAILAATLFYFLQFLISIS